MFFSIFMDLTYLKSLRWTSQAEASLGEERLPLVGLCGCFVLSVCLSSWYEIICTTNIVMPFVLASLFLSHRISFSLLPARHMGRQVGHSFTFLLSSKIMYRQRR